MRWNWLAERAPTALAVIAEGAWVTIIYLAMDARFGDGRGALGLSTLTAGVAVGVVLARMSEDRASRGALLVGAFLLAMLAGVLASESARAAVGSGISRVIAAHPGGLVLGLAVVRGYAHRDTTDEEAVMDRLLRWGALALVIPWAIGLSLGLDKLDPFVTAAFTATIVFVGAGLVALAGTRLRSLGRQAGMDWRAGRAWLGTIVVVLVGLIVMVIPGAMILGDPAGVALREVAGPLVIVLWSVPVGLGAVVGVAIAPLFGILRPLLEALRLRDPATGDPAAGSSEPAGTPSLDADWFVGIALIAGLALAFWLSRRIVGRQRRRRERLSEPGDQRSFVLSLGIRRPRSSLPAVPRIHRAPRDPVAAYLRVLDELADEPDTRRQRSETPRDHAARLRRHGRAGLALDLLAADYQLIRFAGVELTAPERRRAIDRWRRLRAAQAKVRGSAG